MKVPQHPQYSLALWLSGTEERPGKVHCGILQYIFSNIFSLIFLYRTLTLPSSPYSFRKS